MSGLSNFQDIINDLVDDEMLEVAEELLREIVEIENMKQQLQEREERLTQGKRAAFWYATLQLEPEEVCFAANTIIGRRRFLKEKLDRQKLKEETT